jgi:type IV secretion system protein VirB6
LQSAFDQGMQAGSEMWAKGGLTHPLPWFFAGDIWIATGVLVGFSVVAIAVAKVFLAVLIVLAPVFVYFLLSESFKGITEAWLKLALGFALVPLFIDSSLLFTNGIIEYGLNKIAALPNSVSGLGMAAGGIVVFDIVVCICCALLWHAGKIAAQIGGGMSVNSLETSGALSLMRNPITSAPRVVGGFVGKKTGSAIKGRWANRKSKKG